jgi:hypothetical protein
LRGLAPVLPLAGVIVRCTLSAGGELWPEAPPPPEPPDEDWQAAARIPVAQIAMIGASLPAPDRYRLDRLSSCSTPTSHGPGSPAMPNA